MNRRGFLKKCGLIPIVGSLTAVAKTGESVATVEVWGILIGSCVDSLRCAITERRQPTTRIILCPAFYNAFRIEIEQEIAIRIGFFGTNYTPKVEGVEGGGFVGIFQGARMFVGCDDMKNHFELYGGHPFFCTEIKNRCLEAMA